MGKSNKKANMKGVYILLASVSQSFTRSVGALGSIAFEKGFYAYVGSAQNNLQKRLKRHLRRNKQKFWHVDYLLACEAARVVAVFWKEGKKELECETARKMGQFGLAVKGFGSSDCSCESHLFRVRSFDFLREDMYEITV